MKINFGDLFLGIIHFFVIFVPGGVLFVLLMYFAVTFGLMSFPKIFSTEHWLALFAGGFFLGHLVSYLGARLEDDNKFLKDDVSEEMRSLVSKTVKLMLPTCLIEDGNLRRWTQTILRNKPDFQYSEIEQKDADRRFLRNIRIVLPITAFVLFLTVIKTVFELYACGLSELENILVFALISIAFISISVYLLKSPQTFGWTRLFTGRINEWPSYLPIESHDDFNNIDLCKMLIKKLAVFWFIYAGLMVLNFVLEKEEIFVLSPVVTSKDLHMQIFALFIIYLCRDFVETRYFDQDKKFTRIIFESFITVFYDKYKNRIQ